MSKKTASDEEMRQWLESEETKKLMAKAHKELAKDGFHVAFSIDPSKSDGDGEDIIIADYVSEEETEEETEKSFSVIVDESL